MQNPVVSDKSFLAIGGEGGEDHTTRYNAMMHNASMESNNVTRGRRERQTALAADKHNVFHKMLDSCRCS